MRSRRFVARRRELVTVAACFALLTILCDTSTAHAAEGWSTAAPMSEARVNHTATLLASGELLVTAGSLITGEGVGTSELYDPSTDTWSTAGPMTTGRNNSHTATLLDSGKLLVTGGSPDFGSTVMASTEVYDPATDTWSAAAPMTITRYEHTATLLDNGKVLITGGHTDLGNSEIGSTAGAELYDPVTDTWSPAAPMAGLRHGERRAV